ncbi:MAG: type II toxin-antitoxin system VapC family toxin [Spirochaetota bacterium]
MKVFFDTSVIVPALVDQLPNHHAALLALSEFASEPNEAICSTHSLAECYAVLTALPLARRITPEEARRLISESIAGRLTVRDLSKADYLEATDMVAQAGLIGGVVYDALHVVVAKKSRCERLLTYNLRHFRGLVPHPITVATP